jgi:hypothetical protein
MKINQHIIQLVCPSSSGSLLNDHCSGAFLNETTRAALLTVVLGLSVVLATGCASTGKGVSTKLISPMTSSQQVAEAEQNDIYQPARSPAFSDFFGS